MPKIGNCEMLSYRWNISTIGTAPIAQGSSQRGGGKTIRARSSEFCNKIVFTGYDRVDMHINS